MESVQFNFTPYWPVRNYESINEKYYKYYECQGHYHLEQAGAGKGHHHQQGEQEYAYHFIYQEHDKYIGIGGRAYVEYPPREL